MYMHIFYTLIIYVYIYIFMYLYLIFQEVIRSYLPRTHFRLTSIFRIESLEFRARFSIDYESGSNKLEFNVNTNKLTRKLTSLVTRNSTYIYCLLLVRYLSIKYRVT